MLKIANVREIKRMMKEIVNEDSLIVILVIEKKLVKVREWDWR